MGEEDGSLRIPLGVVQALTACVAVVIGRPARESFPRPTDIPRVFMPDGAPPLLRRRRHTTPHCLGLSCHFVRMMRYVEEGGQEVGQLPRRARCSRLCSAAGLQRLGVTQRARLQHAVRQGLYSSTELDYIRWPGILPPRETGRLLGLSAAARDRELALLMAQVDAGEL